MKSQTNGNLTLDLNDDFFWFKFTNQSHVNIWEAYKISNEKELIVSDIGFWSQEKGIVLKIVEKWIRRKNLHGHYFKVATLEDKPYVELIKSNITGFEMSGIFGDVFCDLKVSNFE